MYVLLFGTELRVLLVFSNLSFVSLSVGHFERGVGPGNEVGD